MESVKSKIYQLDEPGKVSIREEELLVKNLLKGQVLAETLYSAISPGTEMAAYNGDPPLRPMKIYPRVVGYCNVAKIIETNNTLDYRTGEIILTFQSHRSAFVCHENQIIAKLPDDSDFATGSVTYLFHLGYHALLRANVQAGNNIAVIGLGTLGITTTAIAVLSGANVFCFSNQSSSGVVAKKLGAKAVINKTFDNIISEQINDETGGTGVDVVITTSNTWADWKLALMLARKGGKICVLGFPGRTQPIPDFNPLASQYFYDKQLEILAAGMAPDIDAAPDQIRFTIKRNCRYLLNLILEKKLNAGSIISSVVPWEDLEEVYKNMVQRVSGQLTSVLKWK
jgi:threonine dehydrogenase-like Zn-dependent dehydrogenase